MGKANKLIKELLRLAHLEIIFIGLVCFCFISFIWTIIFAGMIITEILYRILYYCFIDKDNKCNFQKGLVSITIVTWNAEDYIAACLRSIRLQKYPYIEVIIVDNNSSDKSLECLESHIANNHLDVKIIKNKKNVGFSKAHNQAIYVSKGEYVFPLNFDVCISESFIENMVREMKLNNKIGISSGKLFNSIKKGEESILDTTGVELRNLFCCDRGQGDIDKGQFDKKEYIFGASGCAPFYRREMLEDIKLNGEYFDETFNTYVEDVDLSWRAQIRGWKCLYNPSAVAFHHRGVTRKRQDEAKKIIYKNYFIQGFRNRYLMILKNLSIATFIRKFRFIIWGEFKFWTGVFSTKRHFYAKFIVGFILLFPIILIKRVCTQNGVKIRASELELLLHWIS